MRPSHRTFAWEDPAPDARHSEWQAELRAHPGRWARLPVSGSSITACRKRLPDFEFVCRTVDGDYVLFGRYPQPKDPS